MSFGSPPLAVKGVRSLLCLTGLLRHQTRREVLASPDKDISAVFKREGEWSFLNLF